MLNSVVITASTIPQPLRSPIAGRYATSSASFSATALTISEVCAGPMPKSLRRSRISRRLTRTSASGAISWQRLLDAGPDRGQSITRPALAPSTPGGVPAGVTTDLLGRRPDIVAARERVEAAASRIKVARAGFFPSVNVRALVGLQALGLGNLVDSGSLFGAVGPAISLPIFQGGALKAQYGSAEAAYDEAVANYNQTVVTAYQQIADAVTQRDAADKRLGAARTALLASEDALGLVRTRYEAGLASYLDVLASERSVHDLRLAVIGLETYERGATLATDPRTRRRV
jgi:NodT family efflux transporter outer membrane factor (OMF) lipoprotein